MMRTPVLNLLFALLAFAAGCSVLPERMPPPALHDFGPPMQAAAPSGDGGGRVSISAPDWLMSEQIHYRLAFDDPTRVRQYNLDRWLAAPPTLLAQYLVLPLPPTTRMRIHLLDFEQIFDTPEKSKVFMRFHVSLDSAGRDGAIRKQDFRLQRPCPSPDVKGAVTAFALLVRDAQAQLRQWLMEQ